MKYENLIFDNSKSVDSFILNNFTDGRMIDYLKTTTLKVKEIDDFDVVNKDGRLFSQKYGSFIIKV